MVKLTEKVTIPSNQVCFSNKVAGDWVKVKDDILVTIPSNQVCFSNMERG